jgi:Histidinol-phosphate/aromatic aminotransferase and cobyric acid decarboxylase
MAYKINNRIKDMVPYEPIEGEHEIRLDANESYFPIPVKYMDKAFKMLEKIPLHRYPDAYAKELCKKAGRLYNVSPERITAGNGSDELIALIISTFFEKEEEMVTFEQDFSMYRIYGEIYGVKQTVLPKNEDLTINIEQTIQYINENKVKGLVFSNPCNPTSLVLAREKVLQIVESVEALVVVDEAYMDFSDQSVMDRIEKYDNMIVLKTCSKAVGMAGIRLGFAVANKMITKALQAVKAPYNVNAITQAIGTALLEDKNYLDECSKELTNSNKIFYETLKKWNEEYKLFEKIYIPETNFVYIKSKKYKEVFELLLKNSIAVRCFKGYLRITVGNEKEIRRLLEELTNIGMLFGKLK